MIPEHRAYEGIKRGIDVVGAVAGLVLLSPILILSAGLIRVTMDSPVLFRQERPGRGGRVFWLYKFRTMTDANGSEGIEQGDEKRLTRIGRLLRRTSIDELPELWNVARGDMSLVGPRPLLVDYMPLYTAEQARRHEVRPGLTGLAQVSGRNALNWEDRFKLDVWYVDNRSAALDFRILARTFAKVLKMEGISRAGHATMEPFRGSGSQDAKEPSCA